MDLLGWPGDGVVVRRTVDCDRVDVEVRVVEVADDLNIGAISVDTVFRINGIDDQFLDPPKLGNNGQA